MLKNPLTYKNSLKSLNSKVLKIFAKIEQNPRFIRMLQHEANIDHFILTHNKALHFDIWKKTNRIGIKSTI